MTIKIECKQNNAVYGFSGGKTYSVWKDSDNGWIKGTNDRNEIVCLCWVEQNHDVKWFADHFHIPNGWNLEDLNKVLQHVHDGTDVDSAYDRAMSIL